MPWQPAPFSIPVSPPPFFFFVYKIQNLTCFLTADLTYTDNNVQQDSSQQSADKQQEQTSTEQTQRCYLPAIIKMPTSPDGTYTPPIPHHSLVRAVGFASNQEYQDYCKLYDAELGGFSDEWPYNENGECGNWQERYTQLHKTDLDYLQQYKEGIFPKEIDIENRPQFVSYLCKEVPKDSNRGCGGLADRMGGK